MTSARAPRVTNPWAVLAVVLVGGSMALVDATIVNVAIPSIQAGLGASTAAVQWVISGYALAYGMVLVVAGRLGDTYGRRRLYLAGLTVFTLASAACGLAPTASALVAARVLQGTGSGLLYPQITATIQTVFPRPQRARAFSVFGSTQGLGTVLGPVLGGLIIAADLAGAGWRPVFLVNLPVGVAGFVAAWMVLPHTRAAGPAPSLDLPGVALLTVTLLLLLVPLVEGRQAGWPPWSWACLAAGVPAVAAFVAWEVRQDRAGRVPLMPPRLFAARAYSAGVGTALAYWSGFTAVLFLLSVYLQAGQGFSALAAGLASLPFAVGTVLGASRSDRLAARLGRGAIQVGLSLVLAGLLALAGVVHVLAPGTNAAALAGPLLVAGVGSGLTIAPLLATVLATAPTRDAGAAAGVLATGQRVGNSVGIAVVGAIFFAVVARSVAGTGRADAFAGAMQAGLAASAALVLVTLGLTWLLPGRHAR